MDAVVRLGCSPRLQEMCIQIRFEYAVITQRIRKGVRTLFQSMSLPNLENSIFEMKPDWEFTPRTWHQHYPDNVPPGLHYTPTRAEHLLLQARNRFPDRVALRYFQTHWTYNDVVERVQLVAANLQRLGIRTGDRVMLVLPNCPEYVITWFALHWLGAEVVQANPLLSPGDLTRMIRKTNARAVLGLDVRLTPVVHAITDEHKPFLIVTSLGPHLPVHLRIPYYLKSWMTDKKPRAGQSVEMRGFQELLDPRTKPIEQPVLTDASLPAVLQPTGGTTGTPKIAVLSHASLHANVAQLHSWSDCETGKETVLAVLPFFHVFGSTVVLLSAIAGGSTLLLQANFNARRVLKVMKKWKPRVAPMVPFMFTALCEEIERTGSGPEGLKVCFSGAAPLAGDVQAEFEQRTGATIFEGYGLSEASPVTHANPPAGKSQVGTIGVPLPNTLARIVDPQNNYALLPPGEVGELAIQGPQIMTGYLDDEDETNNVLRNGWLYTGDMAQMGTDGYFKIVDRKKDMIISGGLNIFPAQIETVLQSHPSVEDCAVVGLPDRKYGEKVTAYVVAADGRKIDADVLKKFCRTQLAGYKVPKTIEQRDELPRNFLGKIRRIELRKDAA